MDDDYAMVSGDVFQRFSASHPIDWRLNDRENPTILVLITGKKPSEFEGTNGVHIRTIGRSSGGYTVAFILKDAMCADTFKVFCEDAIESSWEIDPDEACDFAYDRFAKWMHLFKPLRKEKISDEMIRGLIGELYFMETKLIPEYGAASALSSWMNYLRGRQDYIQQEKWFEVKTLLEGSHEIRISSLEQLSREDEGEIVIVDLRRSSPESAGGTNLNKMFIEVRDKLPTFALKRRFSELMMETGYLIDDPYYDDRCYEIKGAAGYSVGDGFPRLTPRNLPFDGIVRAEYAISLESIEKFEVERWN